MLLESQMEYVLNVCSMELRWGKQTSPSSPFSSNVKIMSEATQMNFLGDVFK